MPDATGINRREFVATAMGGVGLLAVPRWLRALQAPEPARLSVRPSRPKRPITHGLHQPGLENPRDALLYVPPAYDTKKPAPLVVGLHGATQGAQLMIDRLTPLADDTGAVLLAPDSRGMTWDAIRGRFGPDVTFIDLALSWTYERCNIDPARLVLAGFSDGASYVLSLGLANGDVFTRVMAFSPGFIIPVDPTHGKPSFYVSHGVKDPILPIDQCSRRLVPQLKRAGYTVRFDEFDGGHQMPAAILKAAGTWMMA